MVLLSFYPPSLLVVMDYIAQRFIPLNQSCYFFGACSIFRTSSMTRCDIHASRH
jgi:hypothetical protein